MHAPRAAPWMRWGFFIIPLLCSALAGCGKGQENTAPPPTPKVTVSHPLEQSVTDYIEVPGTLQARGEVNLMARVEGYLESIHFEDGAIVQEGELLFLIEPGPYEADLQQAQAVVAQQKAALEHALKEYERQQRMKKKNATSESNVEQWRAQYEQAKAALKEAEAKVELARINLSYTKIRAPFDGRMERHLVDPGNLVGAGGPTQLATIHRLNPIFAYFNLTEQETMRFLNRLRENRSADQNQIPVFLGVTGETGYPHRGVVDYTSTVLNPATGALQMRGILDNPLVNRFPALLPGMYAHVRIPVSVDTHALLVPDAALGVAQGKEFLLLVNENDKVEQRFVTTGKKVDDLRVIKKGIGPESRVIVTGLQQAHPGAKVTPQMKQMKGDHLPGK